VALLTQVVPSVVAAAIVAATTPYARRGQISPPCHHHLDPPTTYLQYRRRQRRTDPTCRNLLISYPLPRSSFAPSSGAIQKRARKSGRGCQMSVDTEQRVRRSRPGSEILKEQQHKLSAPLHRSISKHSVGSTYKEESYISADKGEYTDTHVSHGHLPRTTSKSMDSHATLRRA
jgi:hypothetical protein